MLSYSGLAKSTFSYLHYPYTYMHDTGMESDRVRNPSFLIGKSFVGIWVIKILWKFKISIGLSSLVVFLLIKRAFTIQKHPPERFYERCSFKKNSQNSQKKHLCQSFFLNKVARKVARIHFVSSKGILKMSSSEQN